MSREIKFRVWDNFDKTMFSSDFAIDFDSYDIEETKKQPESELKVNNNLMEKAALDNRSKLNKKLYYKLLI